MVNNYVPNSDLAFIIGDGGISRASPAPTKVAGEKVNACLELQSTTRSDIFFKPKTDAQIAAIPNPTAGMVAFSSDSNAIVVRDDTTWNALVPPGPPTPSPILYSSISLNTSEMFDMLSNGIGSQPIILPAPGPGLRYIIHGINLNFYENDANFSPSSTDGVRAVYDFISISFTWEDFASGLIPYSFFVTEDNDGDRAFYTGGDSSDGDRLPETTNTAIRIARVGASGFFYTGSPTGKVDVWYSIVTA